jgi:hypothetical protein
MQGGIKALIAFARQNGVPAGAYTRTISQEVEVDGVVVQHFPCALHC